MKLSFFLRVYTSLYLMSISNLHGLLSAEFWSARDLTDDIFHFMSPTVGLLTKKDKLAHKWACTCISVSGIGEK